MAVEQIDSVKASAAPELLKGTAPVSRRVHAYFAPVARVAGAAEAATLWDPSGIASFSPNAPPSPWIDLGWCAGFVRKSSTKVEPLITGAPGTAAGQVRTAIEATVALEFESWGKLQMALAAGVQQMNVLPVQPGAAANGSGGVSAGTVPLTVTNGVLSRLTSASALNVGVAAAVGFPVGQIVAVEVDYTGQTGFVGSGLAGGYVAGAAAIGTDLDYVRRVSLNVARVVTNAGGVLGLGAPLLAGVPLPGMQVSPVVAFCDREGGSFFQEWSALFVVEGAQGDRVVFHYPRLQALGGAAETAETLAPALERMRLAAQFRALPVRDANDGAMIVCFRSYLPGAMRAI
jgi:hypothetical protein